MTPICKKLAGANGRGRFRASEVVSKDSKMERATLRFLSAHPCFFTSKMSGHVFLVGIPLSQNPKGNPTQVGTQVWSSPTKKPEKIPSTFSGLKFVCSWFGVLSFSGNLGGWKATPSLTCTPLRNKDLIRP